MNGYIDNILNAIEYIENNLTKDIEINEIAKKSFLSSFHFQRIFNTLCGFSVSEYIRNRRLSHAAQELVSTDIKVIDVALKYGYDSPDSFTRAFIKFHGITPSSAKEKGTNLKSFAPLKIKLILEGGNMLEFKIVEKEQFTFVGKSRDFVSETSYEKLPKFWEEHYKNGDKFICGKYGICYESKGDKFSYMICDIYDPMKEIPKGYVTKVVPKGTWAVFACKGALPKALQEVNTKIWSEWLPNNKSYKLCGDYDIEAYTPLPQNLDDTYSEIWIPIQKID